MKPGNQHEHEKVPNHTKQAALEDERTFLRIRLNLLHRVIM